MESKTPYRRLDQTKKKARCLCFGRGRPSKEKEATPEEIVADIATRVKSLEMKCCNLKYKIDKLQIEAKEFYQKKDVKLARQRLQERARKKLDRDKFLALVAKLRQISDEIENAALLSFHFEGIRNANDVLKIALRGLDIAQVDDLVLDLHDNIGDATRLGEALSQGPKDADIDVDDELRALEQELADEVELPEVVQKPLVVPKQKNIIAN